LRTRRGPACKTDPTISIYYKKLSFFHLQPIMILPLKIASIVPHMQI